MRQRIYIETSVWSFAFANDAPDYQADTLVFFDNCRHSKYDVFVSQVVLEEIANAAEPLKTRLVDLLHEIRPTIFELSIEAIELADTFVAQKVVPANKPQDARHVAVALCEQMDILVSWNFRHIVGVRRADRFNAVATLAGYFHPLRIVSPAEVLYDDESETE